MKRFLVIFLLVLAAVIGLISLPCVTHPVVVVNGQKKPVTFRLLSRDVALWSGTLAAGERRQLRVVTDVGEGDLSLEVATSDGRLIRGGGPYISGFPYDVQTYIFFAGKDSVQAVDIDDPFSELFESADARTFAGIPAFIVKIFSCLDCAKARRRLIR